MNKKIFYGIFGVTALILIGFLAWTMFFAPVVNSPEDNLRQNGPIGNPYEKLGDTPNLNEASLNVPEELLGTPKVQEQTGIAAINALSKMHKTNIAISEGYILVYSKGDTQITLWLSVSPTVEEAAELFQVMDDKMPASKVFTNRQTLDIGDKEVIKVNGMGQDHYYWQHGLINYWVAIQGEGDREALVKEVMEKVK